MNKPMALIVEDDPERAATLRKSTEAIGFSVQVAGDGWTALMKLARLAPALVILKPLLPVVSGAEIAAQIRGDNHQLETKIVMMSQSPVAGRARDLADLVLEKPLDDGALRLALQPLWKSVRVGGQAPPGGHPPLSSAAQAV